MQRLFVFLLTMITITACDRVNMATIDGNGNIVEKSQNVNPFDEIEVSGNFNIILVEGESPKVTITTDENLHDYIEVTRSGDILEIRSKENLQSSESNDVVITYQELNSLRAGGASNITNRGVLAGDGFALDLSGAGAVQLKVDLKKLIVNVSGAGSVELEGKASEQDISMSGAGGLDASRLETKYTQIDISGVGGAEVFVTEVLEASVSGVGGVTYKGDPKEVKKDVSGLGSISKE